MRNAYVDPGTGSLAWQLILSTVLGGTFYARRTIGHVWRTLTRRVRGGSQSGARTPTDPDIGELTLFPVFESARGGKPPSFAGRNFGPCSRGLPLRRHLPAGCRRTIRYGRLRRRFRSAP